MNLKISNLLLIILLFFSPFIYASKIISANDPRITKPEHCEELAENVSLLMTHMNRGTPIYKIYKLFPNMDKKIITEMHTSYTKINLIQPGMFIGGEGSAEEKIKAMHMLDAMKKMLNPDMLANFTYVSCIEKLNKPVYKFVEQLGVYNVITNKLNIRAAPNKSAKKVGILSKGEKVEVLKINGNWVRISQNFSSNKENQPENIELWVYSKYLSVDSDNLNTQAAAHEGNNKPLPIVMDGKLISLENNNIEIRDLLEIIAKSGNYTILVSQNIQGTMNVKYNNENWETVFHDVINKTGLHFSRYDDKRNIFVFR